MSSELATMQQSTSIRHTAHKISENWVRPPRARKTDAAQVDSLGLTAEELFWNIVFANAFGPNAVGAFFAKSPNYVIGCIFFLAFFNAYVSQAVYSTRFNDNDLLHRVLWILYGGGVAGMFGTTSRPSSMNHSDQQTNIWAFFCLFVAWTRFCLFCMYIRVAIRLPQASRLAWSKAVEMGIHFSIWVSVGVAVVMTKNEAFLRFLLIPLVIDVLNLVFMTFICLKIPQGVPLSIEFTTAKYTGLNVMILGTLVVTVCTTARSWSDGGGLLCYISAIAAIAFCPIMNLLYHHTNAMPFARHALRRSHPTGWIWTFTQFLYVASVTICGAGLKDMLTACPCVKHAPPDIVCGATEVGDPGVSLGASGMFLTLAFMELVHAKRDGEPWHRPRLLALVSGAVLVALTAELSMIYAISILTLSTFAVVVVGYLARYAEKQRMESEPMLALAEELDPVEHVDSDFTCSTLDSQAESDIPTDAV